ncbi:hypothetical protein PV10_08834 [Exophiala mesophila]|uniref:Enhancer of polycomb-like protein n=2 Tax=Exophiala mesophila TaxID=212818 RepID=A0A0D1Z5T5_EXOME|nr:uncharacterized protein PV10_08834 [Exophiala mesophila]KIV89254.1 hypothetical protein PV10_08834 [Exophiala mesophila]
MSRATGRHTRPKKLNAKQNVQIFREDQVEPQPDYDSQRAQIETGVEKAEEAEYHLQQAIKASHVAKADAKIKDAYIPTPPTIASDVKYDLLYPAGFQQPATYIRSSATVEDCAGVAYCMDEEDELALKLINAKALNGQPVCSEDQFEEVMNFFEETAQTKQPFAVVDSPPVLPLEELQDQFDDSTPAHVRTFSRVIYEHWKTRRSTTGNRGLAPRLKFETGAETDDSDPYVTFRRRELRQIRKTRNRDAQSAEKLRKLRMELETARAMLNAVKRREILRKEQLELERLVFEQRLAFRDTKRKLGIKGDDELLINQKKQKVNPAMNPNQAALAQQLRMPMAPGTSSELRTLEDVTAAKEREMEKEIQTNVEKHIRWNEGFVDKTLAPLTPEAEPDYLEPIDHFREAIATSIYLPTPPASISDEESNGPEVANKQAKHISRPPTPPIRYASPPSEEHGESMPAFRRRVGRGGRIMLDRKFTRPKRSAAEDDRWRFDSDNDDDSDTDMTDDSLARMVQRAYLNVSSRPSETQAQAMRKAQLEAGGPSHSSPSAPSVTITAPS